MMMTVEVVIQICRGLSTETIYKTIDYIENRNPKWHLDKKDNDKKSIREKDGCGNDRMNDWKIVDTHDEIGEVETKSSCCGSKKKSGVSRFWFDGPSMYLKSSCCGGSSDVSERQGDMKCCSVNRAFDAVMYGWGHADYWHTHNGFIADRLFDP